MAYSTDLYYNLKQMIREELNRPQINLITLPTLSESKDLLPITSIESNVSTDNYPIVQGCNLILTQAGGLVISNTDGYIQFNNNPNSKKTIVSSQNTMTAGTTNYFLIDDDGVLTVSTTQDINKFTLAYVTVPPANNPPIIQDSIKDYRDTTNLKNITQVDVKGDTTESDLFTVVNSLLDNLNRIRNKLKDIIGQGTWNGVVVKTLIQLSNELDNLSGMLNNLSGQYNLHSHYIYGDWYWIWTSSGWVYGKIVDSPNVSTPQ